MVHFFGTPITNMFHLALKFKLPTSTNQLEAFQFFSGEVQLRGASVELQGTCSIKVEAVHRFSDAVHVIHVFDNFCRGPYIFDIIKDFRIDIL